MRTLLITIAGVIVLAGGGAGYAYSSYNTSQADKEESPVSEINMNDENGESLTELPESEELQNVIDGEAFDFEVVKDNDEKRILVLKDEDNNQKYKSIYIKNKDWLKVIEFDEGLIYNEQIGEADESDKEASKDNDKEETTKDSKKEEKKAESSDEKESSDSDLEEYSTLEDQVDMDGLQTDVVEDNSNKRITLLKNEDGKKEYKSIYVKNKNFIKIIDLDGGLVYKGEIK